MQNKRQVCSLKHFQFEGGAACPSCWKPITPVTLLHQDHPKGLSFNEVSDFNRAKRFAQGPQKLCCIRASLMQRALTEAAA